MGGAIISITAQNGTRVHNLGPLKPEIFFSDLLDETHFDPWNSIHSFPIHQKRFISD